MGRIKQAEIIDWYNDNKERSQMSNTNLMNYGKYSPEAAKQEQSQLASGGKFMKLKEGKNVVRFMPPMQGRNTPFVVVHEHTFKVPGTDETVSFTCPRVMARRSCPSCMEGDRRSKSGDRADYESAKGFFPRGRVYAAVIDREHPEAGPQVLGMPKTLHTQLVELLNDAADGGDFTDPTEDGVDVIIQRVGTQLDTKYSVRTAKKASPLAPNASGQQDVALANEWLAAVPDLESRKRVLTDDELRALFEDKGLIADLGGTDAAPRAALPPSGNAGGARRRTAQDDIASSASDAEDDE